MEDIMDHKKKRDKQIDIVFMNIAKEIASLSYGIRSKVGAVIVDNDRNIISCGFNGTPSGFDNNAEYEIDGKLVTKPETLHAESNAILKIARSTSSSNGSTLYITLSPCFECAKLIIQAGIKRVVYLEEYRNTESFELFKLAGIKLDKI